MTLTIKGKPHAKVGERDLGCADPSLTVPDICEPCRQKNRWLPRTIGWGATGSNRLKAIVSAMLGAHDEILQTVCNFCLVSDSASERAKCACFMQLYCSMALPLRIPVLIGGDKCFRFGNKIDLKTCDGTAKYFAECSPQICESCTWRDLDPCARFADLVLARRIFCVEQIRISQRPTGKSLEEALQIAFDGPTPRIVGNRPGEIFVDIGADFRPEDMQLRQFWADRLPAPDGVKITFVRPCR